MCTYIKQINIDSPGKTIIAYNIYSRNWVKIVTQKNYRIKKKSFWTNPRSQLAAASSKSRRNLCMSPGNNGARHFFWTLHTLLLCIFYVYTFNSYPRQYVFENSIKRIVFIKRITCIGVRGKCLGRSPPIRKDGWGEKNVERIICSAEKRQFSKLQ